MVFTGDDITTIEQLRDSTSKVSLIQLQKIYKRVTGAKSNECFCSNTRRAIWKKFFYEWYEKNK
jgi:aerobic-type carbon monoxide dehydrogenase small subunit (CoxS/CutS family)